MPFTAPPRARLLVADDRPDILAALRLLLTHAGYEVALVSAPDAVLERLAAQPFDLVLMDLNYTRDTTSGREGLELITQIRGRDRLLPIVVMTGWPTIETAVEAMRRGARSFVQKPWCDQTLVEIIEREVADARAARRQDRQQAQELEDARLIQRGLLPSILPQLAGCELSAMWQPAYGFGGDCYDAARFGDATLGVSIADVCGKGLPAALLMSNLQAAVRAFASETTSPREMCASANRLLCRNVASGKFVTFCYCQLDLARGVLVWANAGHNPPVLVRRAGDVERLGASGVPLGIFPDMRYEQGALEIRPGDRLVLFTDGITEAFDADGQEFGDSRLVDLAVAGRASRAAQVQADLFSAVTAHTGGSFQDDATLIVVAIG